MWAKKLLKMAEKTENGEKIALDGKKI